MSPWRSRLAGVPKSSERRAEHRLSFHRDGRVQCRVVDLSGRVVAAWPWSGGQRMAVDVSAWPSGVYVVEFEKDGLRHALPFMKQ